MTTPNEYNPVKDLYYLGKKLEKRNNMPWIIPFIITWTVFFILVDKDTLKYNFFGGLAAFILATFVDWGGTHLGLYKFTNVVVPWFGCSFFYKFGPILSMGILFTQAVPENKWMRLFNIFAFSAFFISFEYLLDQMGVVKYHHWNMLASTTVNILTFSTLTFIKTNFIQRHTWQ